MPGPMRASLSCSWRLCVGWVTGPREWSRGSGDSLIVGQHCATRDRAAVNSICDFHRARTIKACGRLGLLPVRGTQEAAKLLDEAAHYGVAIGLQPLIYLERREQEALAARRIPGLVEPGCLRQHRRIRCAHASAGAKDFDPEAVATPFAPTRLELGDAALRVLEQGEGVVLAALETPHVAGAKAFHLGDLAEEVARQVEYVDAVVQQRAAAHHFDVVHPGMREFAAAGMPGIAADVVQLADAAGIEDAPGGDNGGIEAVVEAGGQMAFSRAGG